ncbi:MAG TPA: lasso peptide biosynthesis B2 protein, partial [Longimicrobiales bacterium]|nr:lasso peptide biosynthesis B2 protein [Longimicrobiales bacterium]
RAYLYCIGFRLALWTLPTTRVLAHVFDRVDAVRGDRQDDGAAVAAICHAVRASGRRLWKSTCLVEALAAQSLLARNGVHSTLRVGIEMEGEEFGAHAWVEVNGQVVVGGRRGRPYRLLPDFAHLLPTRSGVAPNAAPVSEQRSATRN